MVSKLSKREMLYNAVLNFNPRPPCGGGDLPRHGMCYNSKTRIGGEPIEYYLPHSGASAGARHDPGPTRKRHGPEKSQRNNDVGNRRPQSAQLHSPATGECTRLYHRRALYSRAFRTRWCRIERRVDKETPAKR